MIAPLTSFKFPPGARTIAFTVTLAILMSIAPDIALAKGGTFHLFAFYKAQSESTFGLLTRQTAFGGCGGKRYRDPNTHRCRGPADFGN